MSGKQLARELEEARYEASLAAKRYEVVDPTKRLVARELEARWNASLERVAQLQERLDRLDADRAGRPPIDRAALMALAYDLPSAWNAPGTDPRTKQRLARILIQEVVIDLDDEPNEAVVTLHWNGGRHTEVRVARVRTGRYPSDRHPSPVEVVRKLGGQWPDRQLAVTMNRMRCKSSEGESWTTVKVRMLRERLHVPAFDEHAPRIKSISVDETATRLDICVGSVHRLIREGVLPAKQAMPSAPWQVPLAALDTEAVKIGVRSVKSRRPNNFAVLQDTRTLNYLAFEKRMHYETRFRRSLLKTYNAGSKILRFRVCSTISAKVAACLRISTGVTHTYTAMCASGRIMPAARATAEPAAIAAHRSTPIPLAARSPTVVASAAACSKLRAVAPRSALSQSAVPLPSRLSSIEPILPACATAPATGRHVVDFASSGTLRSASTHAAACTRPATPSKPPPPATAAAMPRPSLPDRACSSCRRPPW